MKQEVEYLGHILSDKGLQPSRRNITAILSAPTPENVTQLKSFLGMVTYYLKFLPNLSSTLSPLYLLLQKQVKWNWGQKQDDAFGEVKNQLTEPPVLATFDPDKDLTLLCDASPYGVGAVLAHQEADGTERPIAFMSRTLAPAEKCYSQLDKEALALIFGVKKFHNYLYICTFTLISDHKPLKHILGENQPVPQMASARLQRWALLLGAYSYIIKYKPGKENVTADALSRLPIPETPVEVPLPGETIMLVENLQSTPINTKQITSWTDRDPTLARVRTFITKGWSEHNDSSFSPYQQRRDELSVYEGCILWGSRVVIPPAGRRKTLQLLHEGHPGISRMKSKARSLVWWPKMDQEIEMVVKSCSECQRIRHSLVPVPSSSWEFPKDPWKRLHLDYAGPFLGRMYLLVIDAHSKWFEVAIVSSANSTATVEKLRNIFAIHGLPVTVVTEQCSQVMSSRHFSQGMELSI